MGNAKRYSGIVKLGAIYVRPDGYEVKAVAFRMQGILVECGAMLWVVRRAEFAKYQLKEDAQ